MHPQFELGLELTDNSKTGWAFSLSRKDTCIHATDTCKRLCYGNGIRYQSTGQISKRERNFRTVEFMLDHGGPESLALALIALVDKARPADWHAAQLGARPSHRLWSLRLQDVGDWHSLRYVRAWLIAVRERPECKFWFYTRSFIDKQILSALAELASLPNCSGLLSIDSDNFEAGLRAFAQYPGTFKLALLQEREDEIDPLLIPAIQETVRPGEIINFPYHHGGRHVQPLTLEPLTNCPQVTTKALPLEKNTHLPKPCQTCAFCLPG